LVMNKVTHTFIKIYYNDIINSIYSAYI